MATALLSPDTKLITADEYALMPESTDGIQYDLVRGRLVAMSQPSVVHLQPGCHSIEPEESTMIMTNGSKLRTSGSPVCARASAASDSVARNTMLAIAELLLLIRVLLPTG